MVGSTIVLVVSLCGLIVEESSGRFERARDDEGESLVMESSESVKNDKIR